MLGNQNLDRSASPTQRSGNSRSPSVGPAGSEPFGPLSRPVDPLSRSQSRSPRAEESALPIRNVSTDRNDKKAKVLVSNFKKESRPSSGY